MSVDKVYEGVKNPITGFVERVTVNGQPLHNYDKRNSMGFGWGYGGAGPHALALSILCDFFEVPTDVHGEDTPNGRITQWWYYLKAFKDEWIKRFARGLGFSLTSQEITAWMATKPPFQEGRWDVAP